MKDQEIRDLSEILELKVTSPERLEKKRIKRQEADARKADELFGAEEERENRREEATND